MRLVITSYELPLKEVVRIEQHSVELWAVAKKAYASVAVPPAPVRVPSQWPLARVSRLLASDNEVEPRGCARPPNVYFMAEVNLIKKT